MIETGAHESLDFGAARNAGRELGADLGIEAKVGPYLPHRWRPDDPAHPTVGAHQVHLGQSVWHAEILCEVVAKASKAASSAGV